MSESEKTASDYARECVTIEPLAYEEEFVRVPADIAHWNSNYADALDAFLRADMAYDEERAKQHTLQREILLARMGKATQDDIKAAVEACDEVHQCRLARIEAEVRKVRTRGVLDAISAKKEALISIGAHIRQEMENDPVIRAQRANVREQRRG